MTEFEWYGWNNEIWFKCKQCDAQWQAAGEEPVSVFELVRVQAEHVAEVHSDPANEALDALEYMCEQFLPHREDGRGLSHAFMGAGELACDVLIRYRPDRWQSTPWGMTRIDEGAEDERRNQRIG